MKMIKVGIIGIGFVGPIHIENIRRLGVAKIIAVASINQKEADKAANKFYIQKAYGNWKDLISDQEIDVVHITTPNKLHFPIAKAAIKAKKHVICEKPLTLNTDESKILVDLAKEKRIVNATTFNMAFYPMVKQAKEMIAYGELGKIFLVHGKYLQDWLSRDSDYNWRVESEFCGKSRVISDIGSHWMHMVQTVLGKRITSVYADSTIFIPIRKKPTIEISTHSERGLKDGEYENIKVDTEDHATIMFKFEDDIKGLLIASQVCPGRKQFIEWEINASKKSLSWNGEEPNVLWIGNRSTYNSYFIKDANIMNKNSKKYAHYSVGLTEGYPDTWKNIFMNIYQDILRSNRNNKKIQDYPTFEDGYRIQILIDSILESIQKNKWIDIQI